MKKSDMLNILCQEILGEDLSKIEEQIKNSHTGGNTMTTKADEILNTLAEEEKGMDAKGVTGVNVNTDVGKDIDMIISKAGKTMDSMISKGDDAGAAAMKKSIASMKQAKQALGGDMKVDGVPSDKQ